MKRIDKRTERKLYWLFIPMTLVVIWLMVFLWFDINLLEAWFGLDVDVMKWCHTALIYSLLIVFIGFGIAAAIQKCWGELAIIIFIGVITILNMTDFFLPLFSY